MKKEDNMAHAVLLEPLISEKTSMLGALNQYAFHVHNDASKKDVKRAVEDYYGIRVIGVQTLKTKPKRRVRGRIIGKTKGFKKAIVRLAEGETISFTESV